MSEGTAVRTRRLEKKDIHAICIARDAFVKNSSEAL